jgi:hypothetical protein
MTEYKIYETALSSGVIGTLDGIEQMWKPMQGLMRISDINNISIELYKEIIIEDFFITFYSEIDGTISLSEPFGKNLNISYIFNYLLSFKNRYTHFSIIYMDNKEYSNIDGVFEWESSNPILHFIKKHIANYTLSGYKLAKALINKYPKETISIVNYYTIANVLFSYENITKIKTYAITIGPLLLGIIGYNLTNSIIIIFIGAVVSVVITTSLIQAIRGFT